MLFNNFVSPDNRNEDVVSQFRLLWQSTIDWVTSSQLKSCFSQLWRLEVWGQMTSVVSSGESPFSSCRWPPSDCIFPWWGAGLEFSGVLGGGAFGKQLRLHEVMRVQPSWMGSGGTNPIHEGCTCMTSCNPNYSPKAPPPSTIRLGGGV